MTPRFFYIAAVSLALLVFFSPAGGADFESESPGLKNEAIKSIEIRSRYANIRCESRETLRTFNEELYMGRLKSQMGLNDDLDTIEDEVAAKLDFIVEKVMTVLDMPLPGIAFRIVIRPDVEAVKDDFRRLYNNDAGYIAFFSPSRNTVYFSADSTTLRVAAHEIGHVVAETYFTISPPQRIHEVMAQYAEMHIID